MSVQTNVRIALISALSLLLGSNQVFAMDITSYASMCSSALGVEADNVRDRENPGPAMRKEAQRLCPMGYDKYATESQYVRRGVRVVIWPIQCHPPVAEIKGPTNPCGRAVLPPAN